MRLFICTDPTDDAHLDRLTDALDGYRMTIDIDRMIGHQDSRPALQAAIQDCTAFVFALTPNTVLNRRCHWEFAQALYHERPVVVAMLTQVDPFPQALQEHLMVDMQAADATEQLLDALYVVGATPPSVLVQLFRNRLLLTIVVLLGFIAAYLLAGPYSPYRDQITNTLIGVLQVADRADSIYDPPDPRPNPTLIAQQAPLQQMTLSASANVIFQEGQNLARTGDYNAAINAFNRTLELVPGSVGAHIARGAAYLATGEADAAWGDYTRAIELSPGLALPYIARGEFFLTVGNPVEALADADAALAIEPDNVQAHILRGRAFTLRGEVETALMSLSRAIELDPQSAAAHTYRGDAHREQGNRKLARTDYDTALQLNPLSALAYTRRGLLLQAERNPDAALTDFDRALDLAPNDATAREGRGEILLVRGVFPRAIADFTHAIRIRPKRTALYLARGRAYRCDADPALAVADFTRAADLDLNTTAGALSRASTYQCTGVPTPNLDPQRIAATDPNLSAAYLYVASALVRRADDHRAAGDTAATLTDLTTAIRLTPSYTEAAALYHRRGALQEERGEYLLAQSDYATATDIMPQNAVYQLDYGRMLARAGETDAAMRRYNRALNADPRLVGAHLAKGDLYAATDQPALALETYTRAYYINQDHPPTLTRRVQLLASLGDCNAAAADLTRLTETFPDTPNLPTLTTTYTAACAPQEETSS